MSVLQLAHDNKDVKLEMVNELTRLLLLAQEGKLTQLVGMFVIEDTFSTRRVNTSKLEAIAYATMIQQTFIDQMKA